MNEINRGPVAWQSTKNHNRMIELQHRTGSSLDAGDVEIAYFAGSAFRITSPRGVSVMVDPWRNHPRRHWDWYIADMPMTEVDIGVSTHAHFDHDALDRVDAHVLLDRPIGKFEFLDLKVEGYADKHSIDSSGAAYDFVMIQRELMGTDVRPPNNTRGWDNVLVVIETGGLRIAHWGDNRHDLPEELWERLGHIDIVLLPVDETQHVMSYGATNAIIERLKPSVVIPHHYYIWDVTLRQSTLRTADEWVATQPSRHLDGPTATYSRAALDAQGDGHRVDYFGNHVAFDKVAWRQPHMGRLKTEGKPD